MFDVFEVFSFLNLDYYDDSEPNNGFIPMVIGSSLLKFHLLRNSDCKNYCKKKLGTVERIDDTKLVGKISKIGDLCSLTP